MAGKDTLFAQVVIAGEYKSLAKSTRGATKELNIFQKNAKKISMAVSAAFAGIALAGLNALGDAIVDMTKAAAADAKSMALLNKQMDNSWKASKKTKDEMNAYLDSVSNMSGILDDDLRPAFSKIVAVTKSGAKATKAFDTVMDISAGTGKDLNVVSQAFAKYLGGNKTALDKLVPGLKDAGDKMQFLKDKYGGMAEVSGANDPFARINAVLDNFKEKLGAAFLPLINQLADWLASKDAQKAMDDFAASVQNMMAWLGSKEGQEGLKSLGNSLLSVAKSIVMIAENMDKLKPLGDWLSGLNKSTGGFLGNFSGGGGLLGGLGNMFMGGSTPTKPVTSSSGSSPITVQVNVDPITGTKVTKLLKTTAQTRGIPLQQLLR